MWPSASNPTEGPSDTPNTFPSEAQPHPGLLEEFHHQKAAQNFRWSGQGFSTLVLYWGAKKKCPNHHSWSPWRFYRRPLSPLTFTHTSHTLPHTGICLRNNEAVCVRAKSLRSRLTPWTVAHQAPLSMGFSRQRMLEWVAMPSCRRSSQPRDWTRVSCIAGGFFTITATSLESPNEARQAY